MLGMRKIFEDEAGLTQQTAPHDFRFNDDNCYLLTAEMYEFFGYPILKSMFDYCAPAPTGYRFQHSDSAMATCCRCWRN
jgi:hypothetical protein